MKISKLLVPSICAILLGLSACKSTEMVQEGMPAPDSEEMSSTTEQPTVQTEPVADAASTNVDDIITKHIEARGGKDKIKAIQSIKMEGNVEVMGMELDMTNYVKRPNKFRAKLLVKGMNMEVNQGYDGEMGWMQNPGSDPQPMPKQMVDAVKDQASIDGSLMDYAENGYSLEYLGEEKVNDNPAFKLKLIRPELPETVVYIDQASFLEVKVVGEGINPQSGQPVEMETYISDYRTVDGIQMAHSIESMMGGSPFQTVTFSKIETNVEVDDDLFQMPGRSVDIK